MLNRLATAVPSYDQYHTCTARGTHCAHSIVVMKATTGAPVDSGSIYCLAHTLPARDTTTCCSDDLPIVDTTYSVHKANCASSLCSILELNPSTPWRPPTSLLDAQLSYLAPRHLITTYPPPAAQLPPPSPTTTQCRLCIVQMPAGSAPNAVLRRTACTPVSECK